MKTLSKISVAVASVLLTLSLSACGGDKEPTKSAPPKADEVKANQVSTTPTEQPAQTQPQPDNQPQVDTPKEPTKTDEAPKSEPKPEPQSDPKSEPKPDNQTAKTTVKPLSLAEGKALYEKTCKVCHEQGLLDAPKLTAKADWAKRLEKGTDTLYAHSAKGFGKMPAQVTGDVSEAQVYAAVDYMISQVK